MLPSEEDFCIVEFLKTHGLIAYLAQGERPHNCGKEIVVSLLGRSRQNQDYTEQVEEGTGSGLYICHQTVEKHGGRIEVESQVGMGTTFRVKLPLGKG